MTSYEDQFARDNGAARVAAWAHENLGPGNPAQSFAYGVAMGMNAGGFKCDQCGASRWGRPTTAGWIECGNECGNYVDALLFVDDPQIARALQILRRSRYA